MKLLPLMLSQYLGSGDFLGATFENWESEFLQMGSFLPLTIWLQRKSSSQSKELYEEEKVTQEPDSTKPDVPGPVKRGGSFSRRGSVLITADVWHPRSRRILRLKQRGPRVGSHTQLENCSE